MKPSKIKSVMAKKAKFLLPNFRAMTWKGVVYCDSQIDVDSINYSEEINSQLKSHETIHVRQAESMKDSWTRFYLKYIWEWICNFPLIVINIHAPYKFSPIEMEAYLNQDNWDYCMHGAVYEWKDFEKLKFKKKWDMANEYYSYTIKPYFTDFLKEKLRAN